jgi:hypothetical protein
VNGLIAPRIDVPPGQAQYWSIGNIGADLFLKLAIEGTPFFFVIATDGNFLSRPRRMEEVGSARVNASRHWWSVDPQGSTPSGRSH